jgi:hypothetical protein
VQALARRPPLAVLRAIGLDTGMIINIFARRHDLWLNLNHITLGEMVQHMGFTSEQFLHLAPDPAFMGIMKWSAKDVQKYFNVVDAAQAPL